MPDQYFVVDANVIISAAIFPSSNPSISLKRSLELGKLAFSKDIFAENEDKLLNSKFDKYVTTDQRKIFLKELSKAGNLIEVTASIYACRDEKDDKYLELAISCHAACIISGDKDLLELNPYENIPILTPAGFLSEFPAK